MFTDFINQLLLSLEPERAHHLALNALQIVEKTSLLRPPCHNNIKPIELMGLSFPNPIGLAAGLDKNGDYIDALAALGFGFIEIGTVTPKPQPGNPTPRLFRLPEKKAIINRMGFNNKGVDYLVKQVKKARYQGILGINIGKNADTAIEESLNDYLYCLKQVYPCASYITINISSPNTKDLRKLQHTQYLGALLHKLKNAQSSLTKQYHKYVPLVIKVAPDLNDYEITELAQAAKESVIDGIIATNTTIDKSEVAEHPLAPQVGGLSGAPLFEKSNHILTKLLKALDNKLPVIASGGVMTSQDALYKLSLGASAVQLYTGMVYGGPALVKRCIALYAQRAEF
jgi:dihydroorotate oxidase